MTYLIRVHSFLVEKFGDQCLDRFYSQITPESMGSVFRTDISEIIETSKPKKNTIYNRPNSERFKNRRR